MHLSHLQLTNFRNFEDITIDFDASLTVLIAPNGAGKTAVLDAAAVALGPFIGGFDEARDRCFVPNDIRQTRVRETQSNEMEFAEDGVTLIAQGDLGFGHTQWRRSLRAPSKAKTTIRDARQLIEFAHELQKSVRQGNPVVLPMVGYYGTQRLWQVKKLTKDKLPRTSRTIGYTDCLDPASSYRAFIAWFAYWSRNSLDEKIQAYQRGLPVEDGEFDAYIQSVNRAVEICLKPSGWEKIQYSPGVQDLVATHPEFGRLRVAQLSDGIRNMIAMVADIAFRATKLNPHLGAMASRETPGIVLIDEIDMHLHPDWQQVVLSGLTEAFPRLQFVATTHSPQVLSSVRRTQIRELGISAEGKQVATVPISQSYGVESQSILQGIMRVDPSAPVDGMTELRRLELLVSEGMGNSDEAKTLFQRTSSMFGEDHPELASLRRELRRQELFRS